MLRDNDGGRFYLYYFATHLYLRTAVYFLDDLLATRGAFVWRKERNEARARGLPTAPIRPFLITALLYGALMIGIGALLWLVNLLYFDPLAHNLSPYPYPQPTTTWSERAIELLPELAATIGFCFIFGSPVLAIGLIAQAGVLKKRRENSAI